MHSNRIVASSVHFSFPNMSKIAGDSFADSPVSATSKPITGVIAKTIGDQKADDVHRTNQEHQKRDRERKSSARHQDSARIGFKSNVRIEPTPRSSRKLAQKRWETHGVRQAKILFKMSRVRIPEPSINRFHDPAEILTPQTDAEE